jgi:hypothetical protein
VTAPSPSLRRASRPTPCSEKRRPISSLDAQPRTLPHKHIYVSGTKRWDACYGGGTQRYGAGGVTVQAEVLEIVTDNVTRSDTPFYKQEEFWMTAGPVAAVVVLCVSLLACYCLDCCCCGRPRPAKEGDILFDHIVSDDHDTRPSDMFSRHYNQAFTLDMSAEEQACAEQVEEPGMAAGVHDRSELGLSGSQRSTPVRRIRQGCLFLGGSRGVGSSL